jgi:hypothetical protein
VDSDRVSQPAPRSFGRSPSAARVPPSASGGSPAATSGTQPSSPAARTPGDATPGSTGRKRKACRNDNLVEFVADFNADYIARLESQDKEKRAWRSQVFALDTAREARVAQKEAQTIHMDEKIYSLEVERTRNMGNMTSALLMLASSMDALTRSSTLPFSTFFTCTHWAGRLGCLDM